MYDVSDLGLLHSTETYPPLEVIEWWYPPMWNVARPPAGRELQIPVATIDLLSPASWFVKQGSSDGDGALRLHFGPKLDWDVVVFKSFREGQVRPSRLIRHTHLAAYPRETPRVRV